MTPLTPCDGGCSEVAEYRWDLGSGGSKLDLIGVMTAEGHWTSYQRNADGLVTLMSEGDTDADPANAGSGPRTYFTYGESSFPGRVTEIRKLSRLKPGGSCSASDATDCARTLLTWNASGLLTSREERGFTHDGTGTVVSFTATEGLTYDSKGRITEIDGPLSGTTDRRTFSYWGGT